MPIITRLIKSTFSRSLATGELISDSRAAKGERGIWQRRYWEYIIRDEDNFARHIDYAHVDGNFGERSRRGDGFRNMREAHCENRDAGCIGKFDTRDPRRGFGAPGTVAASQRGSGAVRKFRSV